MRREAPPSVVYVTTRTAFLSRETKVRTQVVVMGRREKADKRYRREIEAKNEQ